MKIFRIDPAEDTGFLVPEEERFFELINRLDEQTLADWYAPGLRWSYGEATDFAYLAPPFPVLNIDVFAELKTELGDCVVALPLEVEGGREYKGIYVANLIDGLDEERSEVRRFETGEIMRVSRFVFKPDVVANSPIFRLKSIPLSAVFVSDIIADLITERGYSGIKLTPVWEG